MFLAFIHHPKFKFNVLAAHAPLEKVGILAVINFWKEAQSALVNAPWVPFILCADANAEVGSVTSNYIGNYQADTGDMLGIFFASLSIRIGSLCLRHPKHPTMG